jgi:hypothetical protein
MPDYGSPDFSSLGDLANIYRQSQQRAAREQVLGRLGQGTGPLDYNMAARQLMAAGDTEGGLSLAKLAQQQYLTSPQYITASKTAEAEVAEKFAPKTTNIKTPGGDEFTVEKGPGGYRVPQVQGVVDTPNPLGLTGPAKVAYDKKRGEQLANIDDKAVLEADKAVQAGTQAVGALNKALELNSKAISGPLAGKIGYAASFAPDYFNNVKAAGVATEELTNVVTNQALENLRGIFGGNPTEGERKILLDVQGAVNQAPEVREKIYRNAIEAANARTAFNKQNAEQMRSGKFLLPEAQRNQQPKPQAAAPDAWKNTATIQAARADQQKTLAEAQAVIAKNPAAKDQVIQRLKAIGIDPSSLMAPAPDTTGRAVY